MIRSPDYRASDFGKVAVLMGGNSKERAISIDSGESVWTALCRQGVDAHLIDFDKRTLTKLINEKFDRVFIALHGRGGEDGTIQGALDSIAIPYTGSGVAGSALAMDKLLSKAVWREAGLPTPAAVEIDQNTNWEELVGELDMPIMVKPVNEGSSIGASKVSHIEKLFPAWEKAHQYDDHVMAEAWVEGAEYTVPMLNDVTLPTIKLETPRDFYDYQAKYEDEDTRYICPCGLDENTEQSLGKLSLRACRVLRINGWGRIDLLMDKAGQAWLIEANTVPGMTVHSLLPMSAKAAGISFEQLIMQILASSIPQEKRPYLRH